MERSLLVVLTLSTVCSSKEVLQLSAVDFDAVVGKEDCALISFFAPWCGHCKMMMPAFERLASERDDCLIAKVDATEQRALAARFNVNGYPSLYHVRGTAVRVYSGSRSFEGFSYFLDDEWQYEKPLSFMSSPYGPIGTLKGGLIRFGGNVINSYQILIAYGFSEIVAGLIIVGVSVVGVFCVLVALMFFESLGGQQQHQHPHQQ